MSDTIDRRELFEVLLHELAEARDDERNMLAQYALLVPGILALVSGLAVVFYQTCAIGDKQCDLPLKVHSWIYVFVPILPIALVAYMAFISRAMVLRSYYLRILELRIHEVTRQKEQPSPPIPSWGHLTMEVSVSARAELLSQLNFFLIFGTSALMLFGCV